MVNPKCRLDRNHSSICQWTLSLYLMTQCQLKLHHSVMSLAQTLDYIKVAKERIYREDTMERIYRKDTMDYLTLKFIERKVNLSTGCIH